MSVVQKISLKALAQTQNSIETASGLPNAAYDDPQLFEFERDNVFAKTWAGLEFSSALPDNGYAKPIDFMGLPLLLIRDKEGSLKVFHNVCSHRGMILVTEQGPVRNLIRCRYHSWSYDLSGDLKSTPHIGGFGKNKALGFSVEGNGLKQVRSAEWMGIVFINLSADAMQFQTFIKPLEERWEKFTGKGKLNKTSVSKTDSNLQLTIQANWKLAIENYCEAYHLPWVHPELNSYSPLNAHINIEVNHYMSGQGSMNYAWSEVAGQSLPKFPQWPEGKMPHGEYISLYPNLMLGVQVDHVFAIILAPEGHNKTIEKLQISYVNKGAAIDAEMSDCRKAVKAAWKIVFEEDIFAVEAMQQGRKSPAFKGGVFSPALDAPSHNFHKWVAQRYTDALTEAIRTPKENTNI